jgi:hypothetical protein
MKLMKNLFIVLGIIAFLTFSNCSKNDENDLFNVITTPYWKSDSLLANGMDASGPGLLLEKFKGEAKFNKDASGVFGIYTGTWWFTENRTQIIIKTDSLALPLTCKIVELNPSSLKITTAVPDKLNPIVEIKIRMTFKPK